MTNMLEKIAIIDDALQCSDAELLARLDARWREGIKNSELYGLWNKEGKTEDQCIVEVLRCELRSIHTILGFFL
jgi:hypothetical protein